MLYPTELQDRYVLEMGVEPTSHLQATVFKTAAFTYFATRAAFSKNFSDRGRIRTLKNLLIRSQTLYPVELRGLHSGKGGNRTHMAGFSVRCELTNCATFPSHDDEVPVLPQS